MFSGRKLTMTERRSPVFYLTTHLKALLSPFMMTLLTLLMSDHLMTTFPAAAASS